MFGRPSVEEVFPAVGKPSLTYVERDEGRYEKNLQSGLLNPGQICVLTGPSKTGKTSLYKQVLPIMRRQELTIRCSGNLSPADFWSSALENLDFKRLSETTQNWGTNLTAKIGASGEAGWSWLAKLMTSVGFEVSANGAYSLKKEIVRSSVSAKHLIPLLKELPIQLIVEDFHYLESNVKREVFQQWKSFVDEGVSVLIVSTTHHATDIARANQDLSGRVRLIDVGKWNEIDLAKIPSKGFSLVGIKHTQAIANSIARESVGLPIITQQICQEIAHNHDTSPGSIKRTTSISPSLVFEAQKYVAENMYANHKGDYDQLVAGPRQRRRKHATYEKILASFALEPLQFSLSLAELLERVESLCQSGNSIPTGSIKTALKALGKFQQRKNMSLLDWHESESRLYIIAPSFLFYLRQMLDNSVPGSSIVQKLMAIFEISIDGRKFEYKMMPRSEDFHPTLFDSDTK